MKSSKKKKDLEGSFEGEEKDYETFIRGGGNFNSCESIE